MRARVALLCLALFGSAGAGAQTQLDLSRYRLTATIVLPSPAADEASAVTYNWDTGNLFVLGDEGDALVQVTRAGAFVDSMTLTGFADTEGIAYIGGGKFVITEERIQDAYELSYVPSGSAARSALPSVSLGPDVGNMGIEGISFERATGGYFAVKEKTPQAVYAVELDFAGGTATVASLFDPAGLGVDDLSDISVLSSVTALAGQPPGNNLLIYSQESARLLEVTRAGTVLSQFDFSSIADNAEGVTVDSDGIIYLVGEAPALYVLTPVPEPSSALLLAAGLGLIAFFWRKRHASGSFLGNPGIAPVPEPQIYAMLAAGLALLGYRGWRRRIAHFPVNRGLRFSINARRPST